MLTADQVPRIAKPEPEHGLLCVDLFCGLGGWAQGFLAEGFRVIGFDIVPMPYPGSLVLQDVRTLDGAQFSRAACIVASPPCTEPSYRSMPWKRGKVTVPEVLPAWWKKPESKMTALELAEWKAYREANPLPPPRQFIELFDACFRIQREACEAAGRYIPMVVENVRGAQKWIGRAKWNFGSYYLWGDVPALMPFTFGAQKSPPGTRRGKIWSEMQIKNYSHQKPADFQWTVEHFENRGIKAGDRCKDRRTGQWIVGWNVANAQALRDHQGIKQGGSGLAWFDEGVSRLPSRGDSRKQAAALIAKIPFPLAHHIAQVFKEQFRLTTDHRPLTSDFP